LNYSFLNKMAIALQALSFSCAANIIEDFAYEYYPVKIGANEQYYTATNQSSPHQFKDSTAIGLHQSGFRWEWQSKINEGDKKCSVGHFTLYHRTRISLPQLESSATQKQARELHYYTELIQLHELEHYYIAKNYAQLFERRVLSELISFDRCEEIEPAIRRIYDEISIAHHQQQNAFDEKDYKVSKIKQVERLLHR
jgi:predicted secreted Zn-dependent protease